MLVEVGLVVVVVLREHGILTLLGAGVGILYLVTISREHVNLRFRDVLEARTRTGTGKLSATHALTEDTVLVPPLDATTADVVTLITVSATDVRTVPKESTAALLPHAITAPRVVITPTPQDVVATSTLLAVTRLARVMLFPCTALQEPTLDEGGVDAVLALRGLTPSRLDVVIAPSEHISHTPRSGSATTAPWATTSLTYAKTSAIGAQLALCPDLAQLGALAVPLDDMSRIGTLVRSALRVHTHRPR
jgi:hypothetical protein